MLGVASFLLLAAPAQPGALLLVGVIVIVIAGSGAICYFAATAETHVARELKERNSRIESQLGDTGPIRRYQAVGDGLLPPAVAALGEPEYLHRFESFAEQCHLGWLFGSSADKHPTYISYEEALVVVTPEAFTVIPWEEITQFLHTVGIGASNGQKFTIGPDFTNYGPLYERLQGEILAGQLPQALEAIAAGKEWVFEPFLPPRTGGMIASLIGHRHLAAPLAISQQGIRYKDEQLAWSDVGSIQVTRFLHNGAHYGTTLTVRKNWGLFAGMEFDFKTVANSFLLTELLPYVCPAHLLVPAGSQRAN